MKREEAYRILTKMERLRNQSREATGSEERMLIAEYTALEKILEPYTLGEKPYTD